MAQAKKKSVKEIAENYYSLAADKIINAMHNTPAPIKNAGSVLKNAIELFTGPMMPNPYSRDPKEVKRTYDSMMNTSGGLLAPMMTDIGRQLIEKGGASEIPLELATQFKNMWKGFFLDPHGEILDIGHKLHDEVATSAGTSLNAVKNAGLTRLRTGTYGDLGVEANKPLTKQQMDTLYELIKGIKPKEYSWQLGAGKAETFGAGPADLMWEDLLNMK